MNPATGRPNFVLMSEDDELVLGYRYSKEVAASYARYEDPGLQDYVSSVGQALAKKSHRPGIRYRFSVLDSPEVNAFALPGGYIYITRGLMAYLRSEAELAAVLGHEIAHVTARHSVRQHALQTTADGAMVLGSLFLPEIASLGQGVYSLLGGALFSGYGREHELEADRIGAEYLARSGYDTDAMIDVIEVLKDQELYERARAEQEGRPAHVYHGVFASHPDNDTRLHEAVEAAGGRASEGRVGAAEYLERLDGVTFGRSTRQGMVHGRDFYHRRLGIGLQIPLAWRVENASDRLLATSPDETRVMQVKLHDRGSSLTPADFARERLDLDSIGGAQEIRVSGLPAYTAIATRNTPIGRRSTRIAVVFLANRAYVFTALAQNEAEQSQTNAQLLATTHSFRILSHEERDLASELRIRVRQVEDGDSYSELAGESKLRSHADEQLRLLNGDYPSGEPRPGTLIKVIE